MVDSSGSADRPAEPSSETASQLSAVDDVQATATHQQPAKPAETGASAESTSLVSTNANNTL